MALTAVGVGSILSMTWSFHQINRIMRDGERDEPKSFISLGQEAMRDFCLASDTAGVEFDAPTSMAPIAPFSITGVMQLGMHYPSLLSSTKHYPSILSSSIKRPPRDKSS